MPNFARPGLDYFVAHLSQKCCVVHSGLVQFFGRFTAIQNYLFSIVRVTFMASVVGAAVVLEHCPHFVVVPVNRRGLHFSISPL